VDIPAIRRHVVVHADPTTAFDVFTTHIGRWWPLAKLGVFGADATVAFIDGEIVERSPDGERAVWGTVTRWDPGAALGFTWHPGGPPQRASHVTVTFDPEDAETLVTLQHDGWEVFDDPLGARAAYDQGWPPVLEGYRDHVGESARQEAGETWVALMHHPGPAAPRDGAIVDDPRFAHHVAFLSRMQEAGYLVAAGPLADTVGEGMTVLRLPGTDQLRLATRLATEDDTSVAEGFFTVTIRPWQVVVSAVERSRAWSGAPA
jgi:uncharacterized protein YciI